MLHKIVMRLCLRICTQVAKMHPSNNATQEGNEMVLDNFFKAHVIVAIVIDDFGNLISLNDMPTAAQINAAADFTRQEH